MFHANTTWSIPAMLMLVCVATGRAPLAAQQPALADVLAKTAERVAAFADPTRAMVCEERYNQKLDRIRSIVGYEMSGPVGSRSEVAAVGVDARDWVAELAIVATPADAASGYPWREFRDIVSVNGKPERDGKSRLASLATLSVDMGNALALSASQDASNFMYGRFVRAIDIPRSALFFLYATNQPRFEFRKGGGKTIAGIKTWEVTFKEKVKPTLIRGSGDKDAPSTGSFWIDPATGDVLMSVLKSADSSEVYDELTVTYAKDPETGLRLPATATERIVDDEGAQRVQTTATFTKWRVVPRKKS
jgi:hypothetical protein